MAIVSQTIHDGERNLVVNISVTDDAGGDYTDQLLVDASTFSPVPATLRLNYIQATALGCNAILNSDGALNALLLNLPDGESVFDYSAIKGLSNEATTPTGDILITTAGMVGGDSISIYMEFIKQV